MVKKGSKNDPKWVQMGSEPPISRGLTIKWGSGTTPDGVGNPDFKSPHYRMSIKYAVIPIKYAEIPIKYAEIPIKYAEISCNQLGRLRSLRRSRHKSQSNSV